MATTESFESLHPGEDKINEALQLSPEQLTAIVLKSLETRPLSKSSLMHFADGPRFFIEYIFGERKDKEAWLLGRAVESLLLECQYDSKSDTWVKDVFDKKFIVSDKPDLRKGDNKAMWEELLANAKLNKQSLLPTAMFKKAEEMAKVTLSNPNCTIWLNRKQNIQKQLKWVDKRTGLPVIGYIDFDVDLAGHIIINDIKITRAINPDLFYKDVYKFGYNYQIGSYLNGYHKIMYKFPEFKFMVICNEYPYDSYMVNVPGDLATDAKDEFDNLLTAFRYCIDHNQFHKGADFWLFDTKEYHTLEKPRYIKSKFVNENN